MLTRPLIKQDYDHIVQVIDRWWGGPTSALAHPLFFYELGQLARVVEHVLDQVDAEYARRLVSLPRELGTDPTTGEEVVAGGNASQDPPPLCVRADGDGAAGEVRGGGGSPR